ncbi:hypothetical protein [Neobacillus sp. D3-1R]|uniref:hypothetical protein n=1 Tax=Neobacillus sp. D3-1R TaxID=3445778 RepID=UPI003FA0F187
MDKIMRENGGMSIMRGMMDKVVREEEGSVHHKRDDGQSRARRGRKCPSLEG